MITIILFVVWAALGLLYLRVVHRIHRQRMRAVQYAVEDVYGFLWAAYHSGDHHIRQKVGCALENLTELYGDFSETAAD